MPPETGLRRALGGRQLAMIAIGGAIGTGLFLGSGFAIGLAGPSVLISYAIGGLVALLLMGALAEMTTVHPTEGGFGWLAERYVGPLAGFLVRYAYWSANVLAVGTEVTAVAIYMRYWWPAVPGLWWILGFSALLLGANAASVRLFGWIEYGFSSIKILAIAGFLLLGGWIVLRAAPGSGIGLANYVGHGGFFPHGLSGMWVAVVVSIFSYMSLETIAIAAGEARDPQVSIVRAFRATLGRLALFYLATLALTLAIVPWWQASGTQSPFVTVMTRSGIPGAAATVNLVILLAALSAMNSQIYAASRMLFDLARAGHAPRGLAGLSRRGVPVPALALSGLGIAVAAALYAARPDQAFTVMLAVSMFGAMFSWGAIFLTHLRFRAERVGLRSPFRMWGAPWTNLAGLLAMAAILLTTPFTQAFRLTLACGLPFLALLVAAYALLRRPNAGRTS